MQQPYIERVSVDMLVHFFFSFFVCLFVVVIFPLLFHLYDCRKKFVGSLHALNSFLHIYILVRKRVQDSC